MSVVQINKENFTDEVMNAGKTVLLDFYADWCAPCRMVGPILAEIAEERTDLKVGKVNVDKQPELSSLFEVTSIPMLAVLKNGRVTTMAVGYKPKEEILAML